MGRSPVVPHDAQLAALREQCAGQAEGDVARVPEGPPSELEEVRLELAQRIPLLVQQHLERLLGMAAHMVGRDAARDTIQEAFVSLITWSRKNPPSKVLACLKSDEDLRKFM